MRAYYSQGVQISLILPPHGCWDVDPVHLILRPLDTRRKIKMIVLAIDYCPLTDMVICPSQMAICTYCRSRVNLGLSGSAGLLLEGGHGTALFYNDLQRTSHPNLPCKIMFNGMRSAFLGLACLRTTNEHWLESVELRGTCA